MNTLICNRIFAKEHHLIGNMLLVYSALCYLCYRGEWKLNYPELADVACCGGRMTAQRCCDALLKKNLITIRDKKVFINRSNAQNEQPDAQIERFCAQNEHFSEKERTKEKEINKENNRVSIKNQPTDFLIRPFIPPSEEECCDYAQQNNIPKVVVQKWYCYQEQHSWTQANGQPIGKWQPSLRGFWLRERQDNLIGARATTKDIRSLTYLEEQQELARQNKELERSQRQREDAEYEANKSANQAAAKAFFAKHCKGLFTPTTRG